MLATALMLLAKYISLKKLCRKSLSGRRKWVEKKDAGVSMATVRRRVSTENGRDVTWRRWSFEPVWAAESVLNVSRFLVLIFIFFKTNLPFSSSLICPRKSVRNNNCPRACYWSALARLLMPSRAPVSMLAGLSTTLIRLLANGLLSCYVMLTLCDTVLTYLVRITKWHWTCHKHSL